MSDMQLHIGDLWEIGGERHFLDQVMGGGFLLFRSERTAAPYQILLDTGEQASPTRDWLKAQFAAGEARRLEHRPEATRARQIAAAREDDYDAIAARDPTALVRQIVLATLDRCGSYSRSDQGLRRAIAYVWEHKPRHLAGQVPPSPSTVRRWLNQRGRVGQRALRAMVSMRGKVPRQKQISASVRRRMHREAVAYWADHSRTIANSYDDLARRLTTINKRLQHGGRPIVTIPAKETFRRYVRSLECYETVATKWGVAEAKKRFKACGEGLAAHRPLLLGTMDHTPADFHVVMDVDGWRYLGRPVLTILIDAHSRCVVGWVLSFEPPSLYSVTECIKRANRPKLHMLERFPDCRPLADIFGKFDEIVVDNGWEFTGTSFESAMTDVGTSVRWAPVRSPTHKAIVERFFGTLNERLNKRLPGGTFPVPLMRAWGLDPRKEAVLTLEQAEDLIEHAIGVYHQDIHTSLGEPPVAAWTRGVRAQGIQVIGDDLQLDKMIGAEVDRTLTRSGISLFGLDLPRPRSDGTAPGRVGRARAHA